LGVALGTVAQNCDRLAFEVRQVGVVFVVNRGCHELLTFCLVVPWGGDVSKVVLPGESTPGRAQMAGRVWLVECPGRMAESGGGTRIGFDRRVA
jgi:hypothetical protein